MSKKPERAVINCTDRITSDDIYAAIINAVANNTAEIGFVVTVGDTQHFTGMSIEPLYDLIRAEADKLTEGINAQITKEVPDPDAK